MANYDFVVNSHFTPFTMQEMLVPFAAYKEAFDKTEEAYTKLSEADNFKYLSRTLPEGSKAREIYEGYAKELTKQAEDFAHNGLTMNNRSALTSLKRRYTGEIGSLIKADEAMKEEKKLRQTLNAQDSSRLYATDNLNIDDFLDGGNPNLYSVSGNELYTRGAAAGKAASSRAFNVNGTQKTLGGYYLDFAQSVGYDANKMRRFVEDISSIPELAAQIDNILIERGVYKNLTGESLKRARQSVINGMIDGAVYTETHNPQRNLGVLTKAEELNDKRQREAHALSMWQAGASIDDKGNIYGDPSNINYQIKDASKQATMAELNAKYPIARQDIKDETGTVIVKAGDRYLNPKLSSSGKAEALSEPDDSTSEREKTLIGLSSEALSDSKGFYITDKKNNTRIHYRYLGSIQLKSSNADAEYSKTSFIKGKKKTTYGRRVLNSSEFNNLSDNAKKAINQILDEAGVAPNTEFQVIEGVNKEGEKHYSIAVVSN